MTAQFHPENLESLCKEFDELLGRLATLDPSSLSGKFELVRSRVSFLPVGDGQYALTEEQRSEATLVARGMVMLARALNEA